MCKKNVCIYTKMDVYADYVMKEYNITAKKGADIAPFIATYLQVMMFNVVSIVCAVALMDNARDRIVNPRNVNFAKKFFGLQCSSSGGMSGGGMSGGGMSGGGMSGGAVMASEFFGVSSGSYSQSNGSQGVTVSKIDFDGGVARPSQGPTQQGGGYVADHRLVRKYIKKVLEYNNTKASKQGSASLIKIISHFVQCLTTELAKASPLSEARLKKIVAAKKFKIFH